MVAETRSGSNLSNPDIKTNLTPGDPTPVHRFLAENTDASALVSNTSKPVVVAGSGPGTLEASLKQYASGGHVLGFESGGYYLSNGTYALRVRFENAQAVAPSSDSTSAETAPGTKTPDLGRVTYAGLWNGISVTYDTPDSGIARSTWTLEPGADPATIRLRYNRAVNVTESGNLNVGFDTGAMNESRPVAWQEVDGRRQPVDVAFTRLGEDLVGFGVGAYRRDLTLTIDPTLTWNTFLGGSGSESGTAIAVDGSGNVYVAGTSGATWGLPARAYAAGYDAFAAKLTSTGGLTWNTFLGGSGSDYGAGIAVDGSGDVYVAGTSNASWGTPARAYAAGYDAFAAKLTSTGGLTWNTFVGGSDFDLGNGIAVGGNGNVYVAGKSYTTWGSPVRAFTAPYTSVTDAFAVKLTSAGALTWNTFLGGGSYDSGYAIAVDGSDNVYVAGESYNTWGNPVRAFAAGSDAFAAKLDSTGVLTWNTFLGGNDYYDGANAIAVDGSGNVYVAGTSPTTWGSPLRAYTSGEDAFAAKLTSAGSLIWNTFLGGSGMDRGQGIRVDGGGHIYLAGWSDATWGAPLRAYSAGTDAFAAKLDLVGALTWNTFLGGGGADHGGGIAVNGSSSVYVAGDSNATWDSPVRAFTAEYDAFVVQVQIPAVCGDGTVAAGEQCDDGNTVNGDCCSAACQFEPSTTQCRAAAGVCDIAETCTGSSATCPADAKSSGQCRASAGACDVTESCDGVGNSCPADGYESSTTLCRSAAGVCDVAENCTGSSATCPADAKSTTVCRAAAGNCDVAETCDGGSDNCPLDGFKSSTEQCRSAAGICDVAEDCTGTTATCPGDAKSTAVCRATAGDCDVAENCSGASNDCPTDGYESSTTECRGVAGICDVAEDCTGTSATCPADAKSAAVCRTAAGDCDIAENCDSTSNDCPADGYRTSATLCRSATGICDVAEDCTGTTATCPGDAKSTALCRSAAGACDVAENCDGVSNDCPTDGYESSTTECRAVAGGCDVAENCTGNGAACPSDTKSTAVCRAAAGDCDIAENCDGASDDCPDDGYESSTTECRGVAGVCDLAENCTGTTASCPPDVKSTAVCRASAGECDVADSCNNVSSDCPDDAFAPPTTSCSSDGNVCTDDVCDGQGNCGLANIAHCDDGVFCNGDDLCSNAVCQHAGNPCEPETACQTCQEAAQSCDDPAGTSCPDEGDECTLDRCDGAGACEHPPVVLASACRWIAVAGNDPQRPTVEYRMHLGAQVDDSVCADNAWIGELPVFNTPASLVTTKADRTAIYTGENAGLETGDVVTGGGCVTGLQGVKVFETDFSQVCAVDSPVSLVGGGIINTSGDDPRVADCEAAHDTVQTDASLLAALPATGSLGTVRCRVASTQPCLVAAVQPGLNLFDVKTLVLGRDAHLELDDNGFDNVVFVLRIEKSLRFGPESSLGLSAGLSAHDVLLFSKSRKCEIGFGCSGSGVVFCPNGRLRLQANVNWQGAFVGGLKRLEVGQNDVITHEPFFLGVAP